MTIAKTGAIAIVLSTLATAAFADDVDNAEIAERYAIANGRPTAQATAAAPVYEQRQSAPVAGYGLSADDQLRLKILTERTGDDDR